MECFGWGLQLARTLGSASLRSVDAAGGLVKILSALVGGIAIGWAAVLVTGTVVANGEVQPHIAQSVVAAPPKACVAKKDGAVECRRTAGRTRPTSAKGKLAGRAGRHARRVLSRQALGDTDRT